MSGFLTLTRELVLFLKQEKKWWLLPICLVLVLMAALLIIGETSALAPFVYTIF